MPSTVDERVVEMRFDNKQFEKNAKQSIKTLDNLKKSLDLEGAGKGLKSIQKAADDFDLSNISKNTSVIAEKFSILGVVGNQVIRNLTNSLMAYGTKMAKALSIDQIMSGFDKYAQKTESVQTIMNATGEDISTVNGVLSKLNKYSDETSYSFTEMVNSIGKFTSAGVGLEDSETAMEGIANWAAKAGVSTSKAGPAFYNLSQAIGTGALKLQDWKSLENINMATQDVKQQFIEVGLELGNLKKNWDGTISTAIKGTKAETVSITNFNESLKTGWIDREVILETMRRYADQTTDFGLAAYHAAQEAKTFNDAIDATKDAVSTQWMNFFESIFGNYEEARVLWTNVAEELYDVFAAPLEGLVGLAKEWHEAGGYEELWDGIDNVWQSVKSLGATVKEVFQDFFPGVTVDRLLEITDKFKELSDIIADKFVKTDINEFFSDLSPKDLKNLEQGKSDIAELNDQYEHVVQHNEEVDENLQPLRDSVSGVFSVLSLVKSVLVGIFSIVKPLIRTLSPIAKLLTKLAAAAGRFATSLVDLIQNSKIFKAIVDGLSRVVSVIANFITNAAEAIGNFIDAFKGHELISKAATALRYVWSVVRQFVGPYIDKIKQDISDFIEAIGELSSDDIMGYLEVAAGYFKSFADGVMQGVQVIRDMLLPVLDKCGEAVDWVTGKWKEFKLLFGSLKTEEGTVTKITTLANGALGTMQEKFGLVTDGVEKLKETGILDYIQGRLTDLMKQAKSLDMGQMLAFGLGIAAIPALVNFGKTLTNISGAVANFGVAMKNFSTFPTQLQKLNKGKLVLRVAEALLMLAAALWIMSNIPNLWETIGALAVLGVILIGLTFGISLVIKTLSQLEKFNPASILAVSLGMVLMAFAIDLLAKALVRISGVTNNQLIDSVTAILYMIVMLTLAVLAAAQLAGGPLLKLAIAVLAFAVGIGILYFVFTRIKDSLEEGQSVMDAVKAYFENYKWVILGIAVALLAAALIMNKVVKQSAWSMGAAMLGMAAAIWILAEVAIKLSALETGQLIKAGMILVALLAVMYLMGKVAGSMTMTSAKSMLKFAGSMMALGVAILVLVGAIYLMGSMDTKALLKGGLALITILGMVTFMLMAASHMQAGVGAGIFALAALIVVLVGAFAVLAMFSWESLMKGVVALTMVFHMLAITFLSMSLIGNSKKAWGSILTMTAAIAAVALSLYFLAEIPWPRLLKGIVAMSSVLLMLAVSTAIIGKALRGVNGAGVSALGNMLLILIVVVGALAILQKYDTRSLMASAAAIGLVLGALAVLMLAMSVLSKLSFDKQMTGTLGLLFAAVIGLGAVLLALAIVKDMGISPEEAVGFAKALGIMLVSLAALAVAMSLLAVIPVTGMLIGAANLLIIGVVVAAIVWASAKLAELDGVMDAIQHGGELLVAVGSMLGRAIGSFVGSLASAATAGLSEVATHLTEFMTGMQGFFDILSTTDIDESKMNALGVLAGVLLKLTAAELLNAITQFIGSKMGETFTEFSDQLGPLGEGIAAYAESVKGLSDEDIDAVSRSAEAISSLSEVAKAMQRDGGWVGTVLGNRQTLRSFVEDLVGESGDESVGELLKKYAASVADLSNSDKNNIQRSADAISAMATVASEMQRTGGIWQEIAGEKTSLQEFTSMLITDVGKRQYGVGYCLTKFAADVEGLNVEAIKTAASGIAALAEVANALDPSVHLKYGFAEASVQSADMGTFVEGLTSSAPGLRTFADEFDADLATRLNFASTVLGHFVELATSLASTKSLEGNVLIQMADDLLLVADRMAQIDARVEGIDYLNIMSMLTSIEKAAATNITWDSTATDIAVGFYDSMVTVGDTQGEDTGKKLVDAAVKGANNKRQDFKAAGTNAGNAYKNGLLVVLADVRSAGETVARKAIEGAKAAEDKFRASGTSMNSAIKEWAQRKFKPSDGSEIYSIFSEAFTESVIEMADYIAAILDERLEISPVIRPVLDLTEFDAGLSAINTSLGARRPMLARNTQSNPSSAEIQELVTVGWRILRAIQNGSDLYLDDKVLAGRINRRLGQL